MARKIDRRPSISKYQGDSWIDSVQATNQLWHFLFLVGSQLGDEELLGLYFMVTLRLRRGTIIFSDLDVLLVSYSLFPRYGCGAWTARSVGRWFLSGPWWAAWFILGLFQFCFQFIQVMYIGQGLKDIIRFVLLFTHLQVYKPFS